MEFSTICSIILIILLLYYYLLPRDNFFDKHGIPYVKPVPLLGNMAPMFLFQTMSLFETMQRTYNFDKKAKYVGFLDFETPILMIRDHELAKKITIKHFNCFVNHRDFITSQQDPLFGNILFNLHDQKWHNTRNVMTPAFTSSKMKCLFPMITECARNYVDYFVDQSRDKPLELNTKDAFSRYTNDVIGRFAFGVTIDTIRNQNNYFYEVGKKSTSFEGLPGFKVVLLRLVPKFCKLFDIKFITDDVAGFFKKLVADTIAMRDEEGISRQDMIQLMMETRNKQERDGDKLTTLEMTSQAFSFFFGGYETSSTFMCFVAQEIAEKPHIQETLRREVDLVFEEHGDTPPYEAINNMSYLDAVFSEALRMYPVFAFLDRVCNTDFELPPVLPGRHPVVLKPGDIVWIPIYCFQRDPEIFSNPDVFDPERFINNGKLSANSANSMSFGQGPRMCIANRFALLESKIMFVHLLRKCSLKPGKRMITPLKLSNTSFLMRAEGGFWVELQPRRL